MASQETSEINAYASKVDNGFRCDKCGLVAKTKYSITRPFLRKYGNETEDIVSQFVFFSAPSKTQSLIMRSTGYIRQRILDVVSFRALIVGKCSKASRN